MNSRLIIFISSVFLIVACGVKKDLVSNNSTKPTSAKALISKIENNNKSPEWLSLKGKINLDKSGQKIRLSTNIRIRKDSVIWLSVTAPFGIEIFRAVLMPDSLFYINIAQSTFSKQPISYLSKQIKTEINFMQFQEMFFGVPSIPKEKYRFLENNENYFITTKNKKKGTVIFSVSKENFRIETGEYLKSENDYFKFELTDYTVAENDFIIPKNLLLDVKTSESFLAEINYSKITTNKPLKMPFIIPESYVEIR